jgi:hypothetical protein
MCTCVFLLRQEYFWHYLVISSKVSLGGPINPNSRKTSSLVTSLIAGIRQYPSLCCQDLLWCLDWPIGEGVPHCIFRRKLPLAPPYSKVVAKCHVVVCPKSCSLHPQHDGASSGRRTGVGASSDCHSGVGASDVVLWSVRCSRKARDLSSMALQ